MSKYIRFVSHPAKVCARHLSPYNTLVGHCHQGLPMSLCLPIEILTYIIPSSSRHNSVVSCMVYTKFVYYAGCNFGHDHPLELPQSLREFSVSRSYTNVDESILQVPIFCLSDRYLIRCVLFNRIALTDSPFPLECSRGLIW